MADNSTHIQGLRLPLCTWESTVDGVCTDAAKDDYSGQALLDFVAYHTGVTALLAEIRAELDTVGIGRSVGAVMVYIPVPAQFEQAYTNALDGTEWMLRNNAPQDEDTTARLAALVAAPPAE